MPIEDNQIMTDADRYLFRRLHEHARTLERSRRASGTSGPAGIRGRHSRPEPGRRRIADDETLHGLGPSVDYALRRALKVDDSHGPNPRPVGVRFGASHSQ